MFKARLKTNSHAYRIFFFLVAQFTYWKYRSKVFYVNHAAHTRHFYAHYAMLNTSNNKNKLHSGHSTGQGYNE